MSTLNLSVFSQTAIEAVNKLELSEADSKRVYSHISRLFFEHERKAMKHVWGMDACPAVVASGEFDDEQDALRTVVIFNLDTKTKTAKRTSKVNPDGPIPEMVGDPPMLKQDELFAGYLENWFGKTGKRKAEIIRKLSRARTKNKLGLWWLWVIQNNDSNPRVPWVNMLVEVLLDDLVLPSFKASKNTKASLTRPIHHVTYGGLLSVPKARDFDGQGELQFSGIPVVTYDSRTLTNGELRALNSATPYFWIYWLMMANGMQREFEDHVVTYNPRDDFELKVRHDVVTVVGGYPMAAKLFGMGETNAHRAKEALHAMAEVRWKVFPNVPAWPLIASISETKGGRGRRASVEVRLGTPLLPKYMDHIFRAHGGRQHAGFLKHKIPLLEPTQPTPGSNRQTHAAQIVLESIIVRAMRLKADEAFLRGGVELTPADFEHFRVEAGFGRSKLPTSEVLDFWLADGQLARTKEGLWKLGPKYERQWKFILEGGRQQLDGKRRQKRGKKLPK